MSTENSLAVPNVSAINWLSSQAFPNIDSSTRQITAFSGNEPGRVAWHASTATPDGLTTIQWYQGSKPASGEPNGTVITEPGDKGYNSSTSLILYEDIYLEVNLPQLSEFLELGTYVEPTSGKVGNVSEQYYNTPVFIQNPLFDWKNISVWNTSGGQSAYINWGVQGNRSSAPSGSETGLRKADSFEIDYEKKVLRLYFNSGSTFTDYYQPSGADVNLQSSYQYFKWSENGSTGNYPNSGGWLSGSSFSLGPTMVSSSFSANYVGFSSAGAQNYNPNSGILYSPDVYPYMQVSGELGNRVGIVYQSRSFEPEIKAGFRSANPDQSLYSTLDGTAWYLLANSSPDASGSTENYVADSQANFIAGIPEQTDSKLITVSGKDQVILSTASVDSKDKPKVNNQLNRISTGQSGPQGLYFTRVVRNSAGEPQPVTQRVIGADGQPGLNFDSTSDQTTLQLAPVQVGFGARQVFTETDGSYSVILEGMTISSPAAVLATQGAGSEFPVGPYAIGQIPVWLVDKVGYKQNGTLNPASANWDIPVTLEYPPSAGYPDGLTVNGVVKYVNQTPETSSGGYFTTPTSSLNIDTQGQPIPQDLLNQRPVVTVTDTTFDIDSVTNQSALPTSEWVVWTPSFSSMQEAFSVLMSAYLRLYQNQLQLASSVVEWYNGQIAALNECLKMVNQWGLGSNVNDNQTYTYVNVYADRDPRQTAPAVTGYGASVASQFDWVAQTLALYDITLTSYVSVAGDEYSKDVPGQGTNKRYIWGGASTGTDMFNNFTSSVKNVISNLTNVSQQQTTAYSNLNSQYTQGVSTLTQVLEKLNQAATGIAAKL